MSVVNIVFSTRHVFPFNWELYPVLYVLCVVAGDRKVTAGRVSNKQLKNRENTHTDLVR